MRKILWTGTVLIAVLLIWESSAHPQGLKGWFDVTKGNIKEREDGAVTSEVETFDRIMYLSYTDAITPRVSYLLNLRANLLDTTTTDVENTNEKEYQRTVEPALDLYMRDQIYDVNAGYRRREQWSTANFVDDGRETTEFYYSRLGVSPEDLPSLSFEFDRQKRFDYLSQSAVDDTTTMYIVNSAYELPSRDLQMRYNFNFTHTINDTPLKITHKSEQDNFNGYLSVGYSRRFWNNKARYYTGYQGNYTRNKNTQFVTQTGLFVNQRLSLAGLSAVGSFPFPQQTGLGNTPALADGNLTAATTINLRTVQYNNIGISVPTTQTVDRLYIYVNKDVTGDAKLKDISNWEVYKNTNATLTTGWTAVLINSVTVVEVETNVYRYELMFVTAQKESFFKAINMDVSDVTGVLVTEIEAYGEDIINEDTFVNTVNTFNQQLTFSVDVQPTSKWGFLFAYTIDRADENADSPMSSVEGLVDNIFSDSEKSDREAFESNVSRNYSLTSTWLTHRLLTTVFRIQRNESFDNKEEIDIDSNTYSLTFTSDPLPTLDATLSLIKNDTFNFDQKSTTNNSVVLSIGSRPYRDVNMINDFAYIQSKSFESGTTSTTYRFNGTIDALLSRKLSGTFNYDFNWNDSDGTSTQNNDNTLTVSYRPGRFINVTGVLGYANADGDLTTSEGLLVDWLVIPAIRVNANYLHSDSEPGPVKTDTFNGFITWYITKFADLRTTYGYIQTVETQKTISTNLKTTLNCRF